jgi:hypothetical protein
VSTEVTFWNSAEDVILCGSDFHSAEFRGIMVGSSAEFRGMKVTIPHKIPSSAEFQKVTSFDTLSVTQNSV